jgi:hypothetical protein
MGRFDSSETRVVPVFNQLLARDASGVSWVDTLISLGSRRDVVATVPKGLRLVPNHGARWGENEMPLPAPPLLLEHLAQNVELAGVLRSKDTGEVLKARTALANRDAATIQRALDGLRSGKRGRRWFVLEGDSRPDALLETERVVVCVEGKRTEAECTTETEWMAVRSQLLRHMDAATEAFKGKRILGLLIVEGDKPDPLNPSQHWRRQCDAQHTVTMLEQSLPHRCKNERRDIEAGILGVTTWQAVCAAQGIDWPSLPDAI